MSAPWRPDPARRTVAFADTYLTDAFLRGAERRATVGEYARAAGCDVAAVVAALGPYLDDGSLVLEAVDGEVFVLTAPQGRPVPDGTADVPANLWELLRGHADQAGAAELYRLVRALEAGGWHVEVNPARIRHDTDRGAPRAVLGVDVGSAIVPVHLAHRVELAALLDRYDAAGASAVAIAIGAGELERFVTGARRHHLARGWPSGLSVLVLEAPRYAPTLVSPADGAVRPRSVTRAGLETLIASRRLQD